MDLNGGRFTKSPSGEQTLFGGNDSGIASGDSKDGVYEITSNELNQYSENGEWAIKNMFPMRRQEILSLHKKTWRH